MALVVKDRVKETTATTGTGTLTLAGAVTGFQSFSSALSDADTTYYSIFESSTGEWEVGLGTFTLSGTTLSRDTILESSNAGSAINLTAGAADVFITQPAEKAVYLDGSGNISHIVTLGTETSGNYVASISTNAGLDGSGSGEGSAVTLSLNLNELSTSITNDDGDYFVVVDTVGDQRKLTKANINISGFNNDAGFSTTTGTVTSVGGTGTVNGLTLTGTVTTSGNLTLGGTLAISNDDWSGTDLSVANGGTGASSFTANSVLLGNGTSAFQEVSPGTSGNVLTSNGTTWESTAPAAGAGTFEATASGALANGDLVLVNSDGTVSVVAETTVTQGAGTPAAVNGATGTVDDINAVYDPSTQKVLVVFRDIDNSNYGTAVVGTISGSSISFGTEVVFYSALTTYPVPSYDAASQKILVAYSDAAGSNYGTMKVATISGTSVSFGSAVTFKSAGSFGLTIAYNDTAAKHLVVYTDSSSTPVYQMRAKVLTVSGTSASAGAELTSTDVPDTDMGITYHAAGNFMCLAFRNNSNSNYGTLRAFTISGTTASIASTSVYYSGEANRPSITYLPAIERLVVGYSDQPAGNYGVARAASASAGGGSFTYGTAVTFKSASSGGISCSAHVASGKAAIVNGAGNYIRFANVSGTTITYDTEFTLQTGSGLKVYNNAATYDSDTQQVIISYRDNSTADEIGEAVAAYPGYTSVNLSSTNFIGISDGSYADAATATIQTIGSVDDAQTGLTPGQAYYVQTDGTLSTTPDSPSVFAGTAVAATKIIVKG